MWVKIEKFDAPDSGGNLEGYLTLIFPEFKIRLTGVGLHRRDGKTWFSLPIKRYTNFRGEQRANQVLSFIGRDTFDNFHNSCLKALRIFEEGGANHEN